MTPINTDGSYKFICSAIFNDNFQEVQIQGLQIYNLLYPMVREYEKGKFKDLNFKKALY